VNQLLQSDSRWVFCSIRKSAQEVVQQQSTLLIAISQFQKNGS